MTARGNLNAETVLIRTRLVPRMASPLESEPGCPHRPPSPGTGVDFVTVFVKDYPAALKFYGETLGLEHSVDYEKIPAGEFETGSLTLQVIEPTTVGRGFSPYCPPIALHAEHR